MLGPAALPGGFAVRYQPATRPLQVGGDWYDVVDLDDGRIALIVGDCVGHGLAAATVMGQLRSACRALLLEQPSPACGADGPRPLRRASARCPLHHRVLRGARPSTPASWCTPVRVIRRPSWSTPTAPRACWRRTRSSAGASTGLDPTRSPRDDAAARDAAALHRRPGRTPRPVDRRRHGPCRPISFRTAVRSRSMRWRPPHVRLEPDGGYQDDVAMLLYRQPAPLEMRFPADADQLLRAVPPCAAG